MADGGSIGKAYVQIVPTTRGIGKALGEELGSEGEKAGKAAGEKAGGGFSGGFGAKVTGVAGQALAEVTKRMIEASVGVAGYADNILTMSTVTGVSTDRLQAYNYAAELVDVSLETMTGSMQRNIRSMTQASNGSKNFAKAYADLGVSVTDSNGNLRDGETVYWEAIDALGKIEDETQRDSIAMQLFGRSAQQLNPLIKQGSEGIAALTDEAKSMGAVLSGDQLTAAGAFDDAIQRIKSGSEAAKNAVGMILLPQLTSLATDGKDLLGKFSTAVLDANGDLTKIGPAVGEAIGGAVSAVAGRLPGLAQIVIGVTGQLAATLMTELPGIVGALTGALPGLIDQITAALPGIFTAFTEMAPQLITAINTNISAIMTAGMGLLQALADGILTNLPILLNAALPLLLTLAESLVSNAGQLIATGLQLILALIQGIVAALPQIIAFVPQIIYSIVNALIPLLPQIIVAGIQILNALINGVISIIPQLIPMVIQIIGAIFQAIISNLPQIIQGGVQILAALVQGILQRIATLINAAKSLITTLVSALAEAPRRMLEVGANVVRGIWSGISNSLGWIKSQISGWVGNVVSFIKNLFHIGSPSKLMADEVGAMLPAGIAVGVEARADLVNNAMRDLTDGAVSAALIPEFGSRTGAAAAGGDGGNAQLREIIVLLTEFIRLYAARGADDPGADRLIAYIDQALGRLGAKRERGVL